MAKKPKYYQRKSDGLFESIRTINGKRVAFRGKTCREVDRKILEYQEQKKKGRKVDELIRAFMVYKEGKVSESTLKTYEAPLKRIESALGHLYASEVKPIDCSRILERMAKQGNKHGCVRLQKTTLIQLFRFAVVEGDIDISPAAEVELPRNLDRTRRDSLTSDQIEAVLKCRSGDGWLIGITLLLTGCRLGELVALRYEDIDRKNKVIHINKKVNFRTGRAFVENTLKTEAGKRDIPLLPELEAVLPRDRIGLIFHKDGQLLQEWQFRKCFNEYKLLIGLPDYITPHWFRHTFATLCRDAGVDIKTAAKMMGHANENVTAMIYTHTTEKHQQKQVEKLQEFISAM